MFLCGHDHNVQHIQHVDGGMEYVISGGGGAPLSAFVPENEETINAEGMEVLHFTADYSFAGFMISEEEMYWEFVRHDGELLYNYTRPRMDRNHRVTKFQEPNGTTDIKIASFRVTFILSAICYITLKILH